MPNLSSYLKALEEGARSGQSRGEVLNVTTLNAIMGSIRALAAGEHIMTGQGSGMRKRSVGGGLLLSAVARGRRGSSGATRYPFDITINGTTATFWPGTINQLLPSNYVAGVTVASTGTRYLVLNVTASNGQLTGATFTAETTPPPAITPYAGQPPVAFKILIGVTIGDTVSSAVAIKVWGNANIQASAVESFRLNKVTPVAGQLPYDIYYTWNLATL